MGTREHCYLVPITGPDGGRIAARVRSRGRPTPEDLIAFQALADAAFRLLEEQRERERECAVDELWVDLGGEG